MTDRLPQQASTEADQVFSAQDSLATSIELWTKALGLGYLITLTFGGFLMCCYLLRQSFNPGISASDALALSMFTVAYLVTLSVLAYFGTIGCYPVLRTGSELWRHIKATLSSGHYPILRAALKLWRRVRAMLPSSNHRVRSGTIPLEWKPFSLLWFASGIGIDVIVVWALIAGRIPTAVAVQFAVLFFVLGIFPCIAVFCRRPEGHSQDPSMVPDQPVNRWYQRLSLRQRDTIALSVVTASLSLFALPDLQDLSMKLFGYRKDRIDVRLKKEDFDFLAVRSMVEGKVLNDCEPVVTGEFLLRSADVVWHKFGTQALLRYPSVSLGHPVPGTGFRMEIPNSDLRLARTAQNNRYCIEVWSADLFDGTGMKKTAKVALEEKLALFNNVAGATAIVTMYAQANNVDRASRIAQGNALRRLLLAEFGISKVDLVVAQGVNKWNCEIVPPEIKGRCQEANSRVDISLAVTST